MWPLPCPGATVMIYRYNDINTLFDLMIPLTGAELDRIFFVGGNVRKHWSGNKISNSQLGGFY